MTIQITINGANVTPSETFLAAIKKEYIEWPGSIKEARDRLRPVRLNIDRRDLCAPNNSWQDPSNVCTPEQANAHAAFGDLLVLMTAINGDYTGPKKWFVYVDGIELRIMDLFILVSPIWFKSREAAEHAIKIASQEFRLFYGVNEKV